MNTILTGAYGRVGTALLDHGSNRFDYVPFDRRDHPELETIVGDVSDLDTVTEALEGAKAVVHLAGNSNVDAAWQSILQNNLIGGYNCLEACRQCEVDTLVLASSNHVVGMYEEEHAPELYDTEHGLCLDHKTPVRPDSPYGVSKVFLEAFGRYYAESHKYPKHVYALRIGSVRYPSYDNPFGDAEAGVDDGRWDRGSEAYDRSVRRMRATWQSRRDVTSLIECCLTDSETTFDIFYGVSDNSRRWFDIEHARETIGYEPRDSGDEWDSPPDESQVGNTVAFDTK
jgi:hypothetical protein